MPGVIRGRAAAPGFRRATDGDPRIYTIFDAHRLLRWAEGTGQQEAPFAPRRRRPSPPALVPRTIAAEAGGSPQGD